jgi:hypothetical protein
MLNPEWQRIHRFLRKVNPQLNIIHILYFLEATSLCRFDLRDWAANSSSKFILHALSIQSIDEKTARVVIILDFTGL